MYSVETIFHTYPLGAAVAVVAVAFAAEACEFGIAVAAAAAAAAGSLRLVAYSSTTVAVAAHLCPVAAVASDWDDVQRWTRGAAARAATPAVVLAVAAGLSAARRTCSRSMCQCPCCACQARLAAAACPPSSSCPATRTWEALV